MKLWPGLLLLCLSLPLTAGELFRWVDETGRVHYSDQPPPAKVKKSERLGARGNVVETDKESFEMKRAREASPVALYVTSCGSPCANARQFLSQRRIPFQAKNPEQSLEDAVELKKLVGGLEVPVLKVGGSHHKGFDAVAWEKLLQAAGYPLQPQESSPAAP